MSEETVRAGEIVAQQGRLHQQLYQKYSEGYQIEASYDYDRWVTKTEQLLKEYVSLEEAKRFKEVVNKEYNVFRYSERTKLELFYEEVRDFLLGLFRGIMSNSIEVNPVALQSKRYYVLRKLYEMAPHDKHGDVIVSDLAQALGMSYQEVNRILMYWRAKNMVHSPSDESVALTPYAIDELEATIEHPNRPTEHFSTQVINYTDNRITVHGDNTGQVQAGNNATQNVTINQPMSEILPMLAELIEAVKQTDFEDKEDVIRDLEKVHELALANPQATPKEGIWKRIQGKLDVAKTTMELVGFAYQSLPYWPEVWKFFFG